MKISKLLLFAASALVLGTACNDSEDEVTPQPVEDAIALAPTTAAVGSKGGTVSTMVTSSGEWTLTGDENEFVTPSALKGKDGDVVDFAVQANDSEEDRIFTYTFACGKKSAQFVITLKKKAPEAEAVLELTYVEGSNSLTYEGGEVKVLVTSSNAWTLEGSHSFVHPSATSGEDGDEVIFTVDPNDTYEDKTADYIFKMGDKTVPFEIGVMAHPAELLEIKKTEMRLSYKEEKRLAVELTTDASTRDLTAEIVSETEGWLTYSMARPTEGGSEKDVTAYFSMTQNDGETAREATVTIKGAKNGKAELKIVQLPESKIVLEKLVYFAELEGGSIAVPVTANVDFDVTVSEEGDGWLTYDNFTEGNLAFTATALGDSPARSCTVTLTEKNGPDNADPVTASLKISQKPRGLIEYVADMRKSRCYFDKTVSIPSTLANLQNGTFEVLVNIQEARTFGTLSTIMGIEGNFLLRMGDANVAWNQIQLATVKKNSWGGGQNYNYTDAALKLTELDRWYHIAVTWEGGSYKFYIDGVLSNMGNGQAIDPSFGIPFSGSETDSNRAFWIGYAYNSERYFPGYMSEARIWNRALTEEEINAENHFYQVDPYSEGLVAYWKLNGEDQDKNGGTSFVKDFSGSGNHMKGEINVHQEGNWHVGTEGMNYVEVSLP